MPRPLRIIALTATLAGVLAVSACGQSSQPAGGAAGTATSPSTSAQPAATAAGGAHNAADATFATGMMPHHAQAVQMADLALTQATSAEVKRLAAAIKAAQDPEIRTMSGWLKGWGEPMPSTMGGHGMGANEGGMMSSQEMEALGNAHGPSFDRMWLELMITHHRGAVAMAQTELSTGGSSEAKRLAQAIVDTQNREIAEMTALLGTMKK